MPFSSKKNAGTAGEADPEVLPISTPRYFLTQHIVACAPLIEYVSWSLFDCIRGAQATTHSIILIRVTFRGQFDGVRETPTVAQNLPQSRHYVDRRLIFDRFEIHFKDYAEFTRIYDVSSWKALGAELFSRKWFVPGTLFSARSYQLKDSVALFGFVLNSSNSLATRSAILFHCNYVE